jgi:hypothetical protein
MINEGQPHPLQCPIDHLRATGRIGIQPLLVIVAQCQRGKGATHLIIIPGRRHRSLQ